MRKSMWLVVFSALAWSGWWWVASNTLHGNISAWFTARMTEGWQAELGGISGGGFPLSLQAGLSDIALADPETGLAVRTGHIQISAPAWWPGNVTVALDDEPIHLASPLGRSTLTMQDGIMALDLHPGTALELEALGWTAGRWSVADIAGQQVQAATLTLTMLQTVGATYALEARADSFAPGDPTRARLRLPDSFPRAFDSLTMRATVTFDRPLDRRALDTARPQPRQIALHLAEARWGDMSLNFAADVTVDKQGVPTGDLSIQAENWRTMLDLAERSGSLPASFRAQAEGVLQVLAQASGKPDTLDVDLSLRDGAVYLGFIPVAPAPRLLLR